MVKLNEQRQAIFPLHVQPRSNSMPSITGSAVSKQAGTVLHGHYTMDYELPGGDRLRLLANHNRSVAQVFLLTGDPDRLRNLPGKRPSSLVANTIASLNRYRIRSDSYSQPRSGEQQAKYELARKGIQSLSQLLGSERDLNSTDWADQERLRTKVIAILEKCRDKNRLIANNPVISEGALGELLYDLRQQVQHYEFNRVYPVSKLDQLDFSDVAQGRNNKKPCFVWDSEIHIGRDELALKDSLRVICQTYGMDLGESLMNQPANRFQRLNLFFHQLWQDAVDWADYLTQAKKPRQTHTVKEISKGIASTDVEPYYCFDGHQQQKHSGLQEMVNSCSGQQYAGFQADSTIQGMAMLSCEGNGHWVSINGKNQIIIRLNDKMVSLRYAQDDDQFFLLPNGDDLDRLSQISKKHLFLFEKIHLGLRAFFSRVPTFFKYLYNSLHHAVTVELRNDLHQYIHGNHPAPGRMQENRNGFDEQSPETPKLSMDSLHDVLVGQGLMSSGQTLEDFVRHHLSESQYLIVREQHRPSPVAYNNPLHRTLGITRHFAAFFVDTSEKNPIIGTLALAAYFYGAGAIMAPKMLIALLTKLHLKGLILGIKPTQELGKWMSNGTMSEAISAAVTYWQGMMIAGDLDNFFIQAISILRDDPAEVAIIVALAISLGYGLCRAVPALQEEMGRFPYVNYAALGAKSGAAIYDTIMHPGDDWLLGSLKWAMRGGLTLGKLIAGPFIEAYYYGGHNGFIPGLRKSGALFVKSLKQTLAAITDLTLAIATIPFLEFSGMMIHVPFRGITNAISRTLGLLGHWQPIGRALLSFANRESRMDYISGFHVSLLYGFSNPVSRYVNHQFLNGVIIAGMMIILPAAQLLKNLLILPLADLMSLTLRFTATILDPLSRLMVFAAGKTLVTCGYLWDNSAGIVFRTAAEGVTLSSNWLDNKAGSAKQALLEKIQIGRRFAQHWAFSEDDASAHQVNTDVDYFLDKPLRLEQLPHSHGDSTSCLLSALLKNNISGMTTINDEEEDDRYEHSLWRSQTLANNDEPIVVTQSLSHS